MKPLRMALPQPADELKKFPNVPRQIYDAPEKAR